MVRKGIFYLALVYLLLFEVFSVVASESERQGKEDKIYQTLACSYVVGAQVYNDNFLYNPGGAIQVSTGWKLKKDLYTGFGAGYIGLQDERFVPLFWEAYGFRSKKRNSPYIRFQSGYAPGWIEPAKHQQGYEVHGGLYFSAAAGRKIELSDRFALLFQVAYTHQNGELEYEVFGKEEHVSELNFDMIWFTVGLLNL